MTCKHLMRDTADCVFCERDRLRGELSLAEEGLANATQEIQRAQYEISRLNHRCHSMGWMLYPHSDPPRSAVAGDIGWPICGCGPECMGPDNTHLICQAECAPHPKTD